MKIRHVFMDGLGPIRHHSAALGPTGSTWSALCLRGPNGAGKTTWIRVAHALWVWFRRACTLRSVAPPPLKDLFPKGSVAGLLIEGLPGPAPSLWLWAGSREELVRQRELLSGQAREAPDVLAATDPELLRWWDEHFSIAESGGATLPNMLLLEAEGRWLPPLRSRDLQRPSPSPAWIAAPRYKPADRTEPLEAVMRSLALARRERWTELCTLVPEILPGLRLLDAFDEDSLRPVFALDSGHRLFADRLSAGESALLISLVTVLRFASPGAVVLLDEPELHQHLSLMRSSLAALQWLVVDHLQGQLIVASHAPEVWDHHRRTAAWVDLPGRRP